MCNNIITIISLLLISSLSLLGHVWPQEKGSGYLQVSFTTKNYNGGYFGTYTDFMVRDLWRNVSESAVMLYGEYGLTDKLTLIVDMPFRWQKTSETLNTPTENPFLLPLPAGKLSGLGNVSFAAQYPILQKDFVFTVQTKLATNTSRFDETSGLRTGQDNFTFTPSLLYGKGFARSYLTFELGVSASTNNYANTLVANFEYGRSFFEAKTYLIATVNAVYSFQNGTYNDAASLQTVTYLDNQGYVSYGIKVFQKLGTHLRLTANIASGRGIVNSGNQPIGIFVGLAYEW